jgi:hypothetical protein
LLNIFNSPYHKFCLFGCFNTGPKYQNKPNKFFWLPHTPRNNRIRFSFSLFWFEPKKNHLFRGTLIESVRDSARIKYKLTGFMVYF